MSFHKSIPERPHGGNPPSWASTSIAAPPARSDPSGARVSPFARAPESRPAFHLATRGRGVVDRSGPVARRAVGRRHPGELPDRDAETGTGPPLRRARPAPGPARRRPRRQPRRYRRAAAWPIPSQPVAVRSRDRLADRARATSFGLRAPTDLGRRDGGSRRDHRAAPRRFGPVRPLSAAQRPESAVAG